MWVKFCGITRLEDAIFAQEMGADAIGFIFTKSPRQVSASVVHDICSQLRNITKVGVFVNESPENIQQIKKYCGLDFVQLHGDEKPQFCSNFKGNYTKALRVKSINDLEYIDQYKEAWKIVLDAFVPGQRGGTGKVIQMDILKQIKNIDRIILAGGLKPDNINSILSHIIPFGVDVSSGVETLPGIKDHNKMYQFFNKIRGSNA